MNKLPWFSHDHDAHEDTWLRHCIRQQGHVAGWLWWVLLELLHKHGVGDTLRYPLADVARAAMTSTSVVKRVLTELAIPWSPQHLTSPDSVPNSVQTEFRTQSKLSWTLVGTELQLTIPKCRERWANQKSKTIPKPAQPRRKTTQEVEVERGKDIALRADSRVKVFLEFAYQTFEERFSDPLKITGGKDGKTVKALLGTYPLERLQALWRQFLDSHDPWIEQAGRSIGVFASQINKLISSSNGHHPRPEMCYRCSSEHEPPIGWNHCQRVIT